MELGYSKHCVSWRVRDTGCKLKWEVQSGYKEKLFHHMDSQAVSSCPERLCNLHPWRFEDWLDKALSNLIWRWSRPSFEQWVELDHLQRSFPTSNILWSCVWVRVCKYGLSTEWVLWRSYMEYIFTEDIRGHKSGSLLKVKYSGFLTRNTWISVEKKKKKPTNPLYLLFSASPVLHSPYFSRERARSEMLSPY